MKKSRELDITKLKRIMKSLTNIDKVFRLNNINNPNDLKNDEISQAAVTQFITNIHEAKIKLRLITYNRLINLNKIKLAGIRHISSHDYDNLEFNIIYYICIKLIKAPILNEVRKVLEEISKDGE